MNRIITTIIIMHVFAIVHCCNLPLFEGVSDIDSIGISYDNLNSHEATIRITPTTAYFYGTYYSNYLIQPSKKRLNKMVELKSELSNDNKHDLLDFCDRLFVQREKAVYLSLSRPNSCVSDFPELTITIYSHKWGIIHYFYEIGDINNRDPHLVGSFMVQYSDTFIDFLRLIFTIQERMLQNHIKQ